MPTFAALILGSLLGWVTSETLGGLVSPRLGAVVSLVVSLGVFWGARRTLLRLRGGT
jgi:hypothetical protein